MGVRNFLVEGVSGTGKTSVCDELGRRGYQAIHGDRELAYQGDPLTGVKVSGSGHEHHIWDVEQVRALAADDNKPLTFFCGGSRNFAMFIDLFDEVFVLDIDAETLHRRLDRRPTDEWGSKPAERELIVRLHRTGEDVPAGVVVDATQPLTQVVDQILDHVQQAWTTGRGGHPAARPGQGRPGQGRLG
ncbi:AAA family ATPase [Pedococcus soli]